MCAIRRLVRYLDYCCDEVFVSAVFLMFVCVYVNVLKPYAFNVRTCVHMYVRIYICISVMKGYNSGETCLFKSSRSLDIYSVFSCLKFR